MDSGAILELTRQAIMVAFWVGAPILMTTLVVGVLISLFQAATSISDSTLNFAPKIIVAGLVLMLLGNWMLSKLVGLLSSLILRIPELIR